MRAVRPSSGGHQSPPQAQKRVIPVIDPPFDHVLRRHMASPVAANVTTPPSNRVVPVAWAQAGRTQRAASVPSTRPLCAASHGSSGTTYRLYLRVRHLGLAGPPRASFGRGGHGAPNPGSGGPPPTASVSRLVRSPPVALHVRCRSTSASCAVADGSSVWQSKP
jgi:hypothetical protein